MQGDLLEGLSFAIGKITQDSKLKGENIELKYAVVMTQDCDLLSHHRAMADGKENGRAILRTVLVCPAYAYEQFKLGTHIADRELERLSNKTADIVPNDKLKRYHYLAESSGHGITKLILDFKDFYTVPYDILVEAKKSGYTATINELYRENLSQRFANFISRIGLPDATENTPQILQSTSPQER